MDESRVISVPEPGIRTVLELVRHYIIGHELARKTDYENSWAGSRHTRARTSEEQQVVEWFRETGKALGIDTRLGVF